MIACVYSLITEHMSSVFGLASLYSCPLMSDDEKLTKIEIRTEADGTVSVETPWVSHIGPNRYRLDNLPFYAYRLSWGDVVEAEIQEHGFPLFRRVVEKSGNRTVRVIVEPPADESEENKAAIVARDHDGLCSRVGAPGIRGRQRSRRYGPR